MFASFVYDNYGPFVVQHDPRYLECFHSIFAVYQEHNICLNKMIGHVFLFIFLKNNTNLQLNMF